MMDVRAKAEFRADFPEDGIKGESEWIEFPGRGVATAIAEMLRGIGCEVSGPIHAHEHGWELDIQFKEESMGCQITDVDDYILLFTDGVFMGNASSKPAYLEAITRLNLEMQRDARFHEIRWYRWRGADGPGASTPLDVDLDRLPKPEPRRAWFGWGTKKAGHGSDAP